MKVYIVQLTRYNSWGEIKKRFNLKCYKDRDSANRCLFSEAVKYARFNFAISIVNDGAYINTVKAERKNAKVMEEEIYEITVEEMDVCEITTKEREIF